MKYSHERGISGVKTEFDALMGNIPYHHGEIMKQCTVFRGMIASDRKDRLVEDMRSLVQCTLLKMLVYSGTFTQDDGDLIDRVFPNTSFSRLPNGSVRSWRITAASSFYAVSSAVDEAYARCREDLNAYVEWRADGEYYSDFYARTKSLDCGTLSDFDLSIYEMTETVISTHVDEQDVGARRIYRDSASKAEDEVYRKLWKQTIKRHKGIY